MELKNAKINFLGDSITQGVGVEDQRNRYDNRIAAAHGAICRNYGISGTRIARQHTPSAEPSFDLDFPSRVAEMDPDADAIVVFGGTNDYGHGDAPLGTMSDRTPDTFYGGLHTLYTALIEKYPAARIVVLTPLHRLNEERPTGDAKPEPVAPLKTYVQIIREVAEYYALPVLDLFATSGMQPAVPVIQQTYIPDGLHPNDHGHAILAQRVAEFLSRC